MQKQGRGLNRVNKRVKCCHGAKWYRYGTFIRWSDKSTIQRYRCSACGRTVSDAQFSIHYRQHYRRITATIIKLSTSGMSIRGMARVMKISRETIRRRMDILGDRCKVQPKT